jgi:hypothetical protein
VQREVDRGGETVAIAEHVIVPEPKDAITLGFYGSRPVCILLRMMLPTVYFNHQFCAMTAEIHRVSQQRCLPPKARVREAQAQNSPHPTLRVGRVGAKIPRPLSRTKAWTVANHLGLL